MPPNVRMPAHGVRALYEARYAGQKLVRIKQGADPAGRREPVRVDLRRLPGVQRGLSRRSRCKSSFWLPAARAMLIGMDMRGGLDSLL